MKNLYAFLLGMWEFRSSFTTRFEAEAYYAYDDGREFAHWATFRKFES